jgi:hypothetical protein
MWKTRYTNLRCHSPFESQFHRSRPTSMSHSCGVHGKNSNTASTFAKWLMETYRISLDKLYGFPCHFKLFNVGFEVLTAVVMKSFIVWDITPCSPLKVHKRFGGTYRLHLQGWINQDASVKTALLATCFHAGSLLGLFFYPEDGGDMFLRNVGWLSTDYTAL